MTRSYDIFKSVTQIVKGERRALAKAITLIESTHVNPNNIKAGNWINPAPPPEIAENVLETNEIKNIKM